MDNFLTNTFRQAYLWDVIDEWFNMRCYMQIGYLHSQTSWTLNKFNQDTEFNTADGISTFAAVTKIAWYLVQYSVT